MHGNCLVNVVVNNSRKKVIIFCLTALAVVMGCSQSASSTTWVASVDNGDKTGYAFEITSNVDQFAATYYLLDPDKPHDLKNGRAFATHLEKKSALEFLVRVDFTTEVRITRLIRLKNPLQGTDPISAELWDEKGNRMEPPELVFRKSKPTGSGR